jgi:putative pyruvate formate lyase activating enzyme
MGRYYTQEAFLAAAKALVDRGVHNLNFVTPDHFWPHIEVLCHALRRRGESIPFLFNSSGYHLPEMVEMYAEWMDIFMPDFKFADAALARQCIGDGRYPERALSALEKMVSYSGFLRPWDPSGQVPAQQGVLVRHLVLPGFVDNSLKVLTLLYEHFGPDLPLSVMSQFHPVPACTSRGMLTGKLPIEAYRRVYNHAVDLGFTHAFMQDIPQSSCFLPDFSRDEPFQGNRYESHE